MSVNAVTFASTNADNSHGPNIESARIILKPISLSELSNHVKYIWFGEAA